DSVQHHALFKIHGTIAKNTIARLTEAATGGKAPDFTVKTATGLKNLSDYKGRYLYIHFFNPSSEKSKMELPVLQNLYKKYGKEIIFLTISKESHVNEGNKNSLKELPWEHAIVPDNYTTLWENYHVGTFPMYVLIDPYAYIVQSPALGPLPNNLYETIDKVFFEIQKSLKQ